MATTYEIRDYGLVIETFHHNPLKIVRRKAQEYADANDVEVIVVNLHRNTLLSIHRPHTKPI